MSDITRKQFIVRLPEEYVAKIDARAKELGISRNRWFENMTRWALFNKDAETGVKR